MSDAAGGTSPYDVDLLSRSSRRRVSEEELDRVGEAAGFEERPARRRRRNGKSPMKSQVHAWVRPDTRREIQDEAEYHDTTQGMIITKAWEHYKKSGLAQLPGLDAAAEGD